MASIVDPYEGFKSFKDAFRKKIIDPVLCEGHKDLYIFLDTADNKPRLTYAIINEDIVKAFAVYASVEPIDGIRCFGVGYATDTEFRNQGLAQKVLKNSLIDVYKTFSNLLNSSKIYVEAIISENNYISHKVASNILSKNFKKITDRLSGVPARKYELLMDKDTFVN